MGQPQTLTTAWVVIPAYNEATALASVLTEVRVHFDNVIVVDDGSRDNTASIAADLGAVVLRHVTNLGQGAALLTGVRYAVDHLGAAYVVTLDADGQHAPSDAAAMVQVAVHQNVQVVLGSRVLGSSNAGGARRLLLRAATLLTRLTTRLAVTDTHNGLRVLRADAARELVIRLHGMSHASEILDQVASRGWSYIEHPVTVSYTDHSRAHGQPAYNALNIVFDLALHRMRSAT